MKTDLYITNKHRIIYVSAACGDSWYRFVDKGDAIEGTHRMYPVPTTVKLSSTLYSATWLPNDAIVSDFYPELFI